MRKIILISLVILFALGCSPLKPVQIGEGTFVNIAVLAGQEFQLVTLDNAVYKVYNLRPDYEGIKTKPWIIGQHYYLYLQQGECGGAISYLVPVKPDWWK